MRRSMGDESAFRAGTTRGVAPLIQLANRGAVRKKKTFCHSIVPIPSHNAYMKPSLNSAWHGWIAIYLSWRVLPVISWYFTKFQPQTPFGFNMFNCHFSWTQLRVTNSLFSVCFCLMVCLKWELVRMSTNKALNKVGWPISSSFSKILIVGLILWW